MNNYMEVALKEAMKAKKYNEVPIGAVIVRDNKIIAKAHNLRHRTKNVLSHAEILAIKKAEKKIGDWRLDCCEMYVTLEPCEMCRGIIKESRISKVFFLVEKNEQKSNFSNTKFMKIDGYPQQKSNFYGEFLSDFFRRKR